MSLVRLDDIHLVLGGRRILTGVDLTVEAGSRVGVAGPNGSGKTTLLSVVATLIAPTTGQGSVLGSELGSPRVVDVRPQIGLIGHEPALWDELTLVENLRHLARLTGREDVEAARVLDQVGLGAAAHLRAGICSSGMRRRADLARLLMTSPRLLLLDEAEAGLDTAAVAIVEELCARTVRDGGGVVMVSHDPGLLANRADRVVPLRDGATS